MGLEAIRRIVGVAQVADLSELGPLRTPTELSLLSLARYFCVSRNSITSIDTVVAATDACRRRLEQALAGETPHSSLGPPARDATLVLGESRRRRRVVCWLVAVAADYDFIGGVPCLSFQVPGRGIVQDAPGAAVDQRGRGGLRQGSPVRPHHPLHGVWRVRLCGGGRSRQ